MVTSNKLIQITMRKRERYVKVTKKIITQPYTLNNNSQVANFYMSESNCKVKTKYDISAETPF